MSLSPLHIIVVLLLVLLLFGTGKLPRLMGDLAEGIKAFKKGMKDEKGEGAKESGRQISPPDIDHEPVETLRNSED
ncbi:MAG: twin-arginine translocase TatA/TatE family subunit, partial [Alphaproteobacteria bacterium]|nr:twin-arginine translocase TatA/TatE family subunit [Alphaproteobacteria bacterium]